MEKITGIVLCHGVNPDGTLTKQTRQRVDEGIRLYVSGAVERLILSGGRILGHNFSVAEKMEEYASSRTDGEIILEDLSLDTVGQLVFLKEGILDPEEINRVHFITHFWHAPKAEFMAYSILDDQYKIEITSLRMPGDDSLRRKDFVKISDFVNGFHANKPKNGSLTKHLVASHPWYNGRYPYRSFQPEYFLEGVERLKKQNKKTQNE